MRRILKSYLKEESGQFALITAIFAVPLVICIGIAIDTAFIHNKSTTLQTSLDSAALAAVIPGNLSNDERANYAKEVFHHNYDDPFPVDVKVIASPSRVDIQGVVEKETLFMGIGGTNSVSQRQKSAAIKTVEDVICVMTLDPTARGSLRFEKNALVQAPACSIQVNSSDQNALIAAGNYQPNAKKICVHGGVNGNVGPNAQANCSALPDPYEHITVPNMVGGSSECNYGPVDALVPAAAQALFEYLIFGGVNQNIVDQVYEIMDTTFAVGPNNDVRYPGVYCHGLHFYDSETTLMPGTYYMQDGPLSIGAGASVVGDGVTFVFRGENSYLYTYDDVSIDFKAPRTGEYAGLIFLQDRNSSTDMTSIIKGNTNIKLVGTTYLPTQDLFVGGLGEMGATSPAMAFIAENITFTSDIDEIISANEDDFQYFKFAMEEVANMLFQMGLSPYQVDYSSATGGSDGSLEKDFTTNIQTHLGSQAETGIPFAKSDGGARLVSVDNSPL